jgi:hypothetical protein
MTCADTSQIRTSVPIGTFGSCCSGCGASPCCCGPSVQDFITADGNRYFNDETPAGMLDGVNRAFSIANDAVEGTLALFLNGQRMVRYIDFDYFASKITLAFSPNAAIGIFHEDRLRVEYFAAKKCC